MKNTDTNESLRADRPSRRLIRGPYNYDTNQASEASGLRCEDPSLAIQSQKEEADINNIVRMFGVTKQLPQTLVLPSYGDFSGVSDYHQAQSLILEAQSAFQGLPSGLRAQFNNDPAAFLDFVENTADAEQLAKLGLQRNTSNDTYLFEPPRQYPAGHPANGTGVDETPAQ